MSRSIENWQEQLALATKCRRQLWSAMETLDEVDVSRWPDTTEVVCQIEGHLYKTLAEINRLIGMVTHDFDQ